MSPKRIQLSRRKGFRKPADAVVVARPSRWGNPFRIYHGHSLIGPSWTVARETWSHIRAEDAIYGYITSSRPMGAGDAVAQFRMLMDVRLRDEPDRLREWLAPLRGKDLCCWCPLESPCHADCLLGIANIEVSS